MAKLKCERCGYEDNGEYVFCHHSGLWLCTECVPNVEQEMYGGVVVDGIWSTK